jgi:hypothetical protein
MLFGFNLFMSEILSECRLSMLNVTVALRWSDHSGLWIEAGEEAVQEAFSILCARPRTFDISSDILGQFPFELLIESIERVKHAFQSFKGGHFRLAWRCSSSHWFWSWRSLRIASLWGLLALSETAKQPLAFCYVFLLWGLETIALTRSHRMLGFEPQAAALLGVAL